jgi:hypothetical protein
LPVIPLTAAASSFSFSLSLVSLLCFAYQATYTIPKKGTNESLEKKKKNGTIHNWLIQVTIQISRSLLNS